LPHTVHTFSKAGLSVHGGARGAILALVALLPDVVGSDSSSSDSLVPHFRGHLGIHLTWYFFHPENGFSGFLDPKNVGKDIEFITPRQTQMELYWM